MRVNVCVRAFVFMCVRVVCAGTPVCLCCGPQMLQWCAGVAFAEAGVRMCCCCCSLSVERAGASMVPRCLNSASTNSVRQEPALSGLSPANSPSQREPHS